MAANKTDVEEFMTDKFRTKYSGNYAYLIPLVPTYLNIVSNWYATHQFHPKWMEEQDVIDAGFYEEDAKILYHSHLEFIRNMLL